LLFFFSETRMKDLFFILYIYVDVDDVT